MDPGESCSGMSFKELLLGDLRLDPSQWEDRSPPPPPATGPGGPETSQYCEVDALVHDEWVQQLRDIKGGRVPESRLPVICQEEVHWLLQQSSETSLPDDWQRVHMVCVRKPPPELQTSKRTLVPQANGYSCESLHEFLTQVAQENMLLSWKELVSVLQGPSKHHTSRTPLTSAFVHELVQQLYHQPVRLLQTHNSDDPRDRTWNQAPHKSHTCPRRTRLNSGTEHGSLKTHGSGEAPEGQSLAHPNLSTLLVALESSHAFYFVYPFLRFTLFDAVMHSPAMLEDSVAKPLFVLHQLLSLLQYCHGKGATLGSIGLTNVFMDARLWVQMRLPVDALALPMTTPTKQPGCEETREEVAEKVPKTSSDGRVADSDKVATLRAGVQLETVSHEEAEVEIEEAVSIGDHDDSNDSRSPCSTPQSSPCHSQAGSTHTLTGVVDTLFPSTTPTQFTPTYQYPPVKLRLCEATMKWRHGELSNFDYLLLLNQHAGRVPGDPNNHPIFPWVMEFTHKDGGYRDLSKSKYRLSKGDQQLDFTYISAQEEMRHRWTSQDGLVPHHIGDISSDVTYYVYLARRTPREVLCSHVRPQWVPEEYPSSLEKMYTWTPDECIPEFFTDPSLFRSIHPDLPDLALPSWASSQEEVIATHRAVLEGDIVSSNLHYWIDIMFGYKLSGHDAVRAKNVYVSLVDKHKEPKNCGIVQLFKSSHPKRLQRSSAPLTVLEWNSYLSMSSLGDATLFNIQQRPCGENGFISPLSPITSSSQNGTRDSSSSKKGTPEPSNQKTLEDIINNRNPTTLEDISGSDPGQENQEDEFTSSFEHVNMEDVKDKLAVPTSTPNVSSSSGNSTGGSGGGAGTELGMGINYADIGGSTPFLDKGKGTPSVHKSSVVTSSSSSRFKNPVVNMIFSRQRNKSHVPEMEFGNDKTQGVSLPREANFLQRLNRMEEMANFAFKSCRDDGTLYQMMWDPDNLPVFDKSSEAGSHLVVRVLECLEACPDYYPSFEERVAMDVAQVACTMLELCCMKQLRSAMPHPSCPAQRISCVRKVLATGLLRIPSFLAYLVDFALCPDVKSGLSSVFKEPHLPSLSSSILLQPFLPVISFPPYFNKLYTFTSELERRCRGCGLDYATLNIRKLSSQGLALKKGLSERDLEPILTFISEKLEGLLEAVSEEGFPLLLLHLFPFFQYPQSSFDAVYSFLPLLTQHMSRRSVERIFISIVIRLFDTATEPHHRGQLYSRTTSDVIVKRFGLSMFLNRFLGFLIEAVVEPLRQASKNSSNKRHNSNIVRLKSQTSVLALMASDILQSQTYNSPDRHEMSANLSYSIGMSDHAYNDSDKEYSSSEESEEEDMVDCSLLAKSSILSGNGEPSDSLNVTQSPLVMAAEKAAAYSSSGGKGSEREGGWFKNSDHPLADNVVFSSQDEAQKRGPLNSQYGTSSFQNLPPEEQLLSLQESVSLTSSSKFDPTQSLMSYSSEDSVANEVKFNSLPPSRLAGVGQRDRMPSFPGGLKIGLPLRSNSYDHYSGSGSSREGSLVTLGDEREEEEEEEEGGVTGEEGEVDSQGDENTADNDPGARAVNLRISKIAGDCLCWLLRRLGPILATRHIVRPLIESLHRCFTGIMDPRGKEVVALKCFTDFAECYGETVVRKLYIPHAENMVGVAISRMSLKAEANVAASLGLVKVSIKVLSSCTLRDLALEICDRYFLPLIQLLSSQTSFPSGGRGRGAICQSMVGLLELMGNALGREDACTILGPTLQLFFATFSGVHATTPTHSTNSTPLTRAAQSHPLTSSIKNTNSTSRTNKTVEFSTRTDEEEESATGTGNIQTDNIQESEFYKQLSTTFSKALVHSSYITFCKLLGQYYLQDMLLNADLIEQLAYSHDEEARPDSPPATIFTDPGAVDLDATSDSSDSESEEEDDDEDEEEETAVARDAALKVGPVVALTQLNMEEAGFRKSSWFVDLEDNVSEETAGNKDGPLTPTKLAGKGDTLQRSIATFDAKFPTLTHGTESSSTPAGKVQGSTAAPVTMPTTTDLDFTLSGAWEDYWESQLVEPVYQREGFHQFKGGRLQVYQGQKAAVALSVSDGEHFFVSGSKDKTVKVWSLRNQGAGSLAVGPQLTYTGHQKPLVAVELLEEIDMVASCDGALHLWDPETGYLVHQFTSPRTSSFVAVKPLATSHAVLVAATADAHLRFVDTRMKSLQHLWRLQFPTAGVIKSMAVTDSWVSVGNSTGSINTLDVKTGEMLSLWKPMDQASDHQNITWNETLNQIRPTKRGHLVSSMGNGMLSLWRPTHGRLLYHLRGQGHVTSCLEVVGEQLLSGATNGTLAIHSVFEASKDYQMATYRCSRKAITALAALQENRLLLVALDNGQIILMA